MKEELYFAFSNNGDAEKGTIWRNVPVKNMRNAFINVNHDDSINFKGRLYYQTSISDDWSEMEIDCHQGQDLFRKVHDNFIPCSKEEFLEYTKDGFDIRARKIELKREKAASISYLNNKFIYFDNHRMVSDEKLNHYLINRRIPFLRGCNGFHIRSFIIDVKAETDSFYKTMFHYLPTGNIEWQCIEKNFSKPKLLEAFGSGLIEETTDIVLAKYSLISNPVPRNNRRRKRII